MDGDWNKMMNFCRDMKFFLENILGHKSKHLISAKTLNSEKSAKINRFNTLIAGWLIVKENIEIP